MNLDLIAAALVTRGDVDLARIRDDLPFGEVVVWDNSRRGNDLRVYGRYAAAAETTRPFIYVQDDDAICPAAALADIYDGDGLQVNVPAGEKPWVSWGALFPRDLPATVFAHYLAAYPDDVFFRRWCDVAFAHLAGWRQVDLGHEELPWFDAPNRMHREPQHYVEQDEMWARAMRLQRVAA